MNLPLIEDVVPHRGRMLLLDRVVSWSGESAACVLTVQDDPLFCRDGVVGAWVGIEYMAQTVAALIGLKALAKGLPVKVGLLLGTRRFASEVAGFVPGESLEVRASQVLQGENGLAAFECGIFKQGKVIAEATISAFQPDDVMRFLKGSKA